VRKNTARSLPRSIEPLPAAGDTGRERALSTAPTQSAVNLAVNFA
jgi:hypothetical protein